MSPAWPPLEVSVLGACALSASIGCVSILHVWVSADIYTLFYLVTGNVGFFLGCSPSTFPLPLVTQVLISSRRCKQSTRRAVGPTGSRLEQPSASERVLLPTNHVRAPRTERLGGRGCVLPAARALFFGSWHDNYFICRLFADITTFQIDQECPFNLSDIRSQRGGLLGQ